MNNKEDWLVTNDSVMGGLSLGKSELLNNTVIFSGQLSTQNNGGFTSIFKKISSISKSATKVKIRILGDGNSYQLRFRAQVLGYEIVYQVVFPTDENIVTEHLFDLSNFCAVFRGRNLANAPSLEPENISHIGFLTTAALIKNEHPQRFILRVYNIDFHD